VNPIQNHKAWNKKKGKASDIYLCPSLISRERERERDGQKELNFIKRTDYECVVNHRCLFFASFLYTHTHKRSLVEFTRLLASTTWVIIMGGENELQLGKEKLGKPKSPAQGDIPSFSTLLSSCGHLLSLRDDGIV
jgi:hypothetical protein